MEILVAVIHLTMSNITLVGDGINSRKIISFDTPSKEMAQDESVTIVLLL